jgi:hypothetical protein
VETAAAGAGGASFLTGSDLMFTTGADGISARAESGAGALTFAAAEGAPRWPDPREEALSEEADAWPRPGCADADDPLSGAEVSSANAAGMSATP